MQPWLRYRPNNKLRTDRQTDGFSALYGSDNDNKMAFCNDKLKFAIPLFFSAFYSLPSCDLLLGDCAAWCMRLTVTSKQWPVAGAIEIGK